MTNALTAIGLAADVVGAVTLTIGLFRHPRPNYPGWSYSADEAARDQAYGVSGASLLIAGFILQALPSFGVTWLMLHCAALFASMIAVCASGLAAVLLYSVALLVGYPYKQRTAREQIPNTNAPLMRFVLRPRRWRPRLWALVEKGGLK